jgi:peptidoglycan/xylan/chitin deacetylase (PgdA/CDA1 family)
MTGASFGSIILSFDDAYLVDKTAIPIMNEYGYKGVTFFAAIWGIKEWQDYVVAGWEIGCHSYSHIRLDMCSMEQLQYEIVYAKQYILENCPGVSEVVSYALPDGAGIHNETVLTLIRSNYKYLRDLDSKSFSTDLEGIWFSEAQKGVNYARNGGVAWFVFHAISDQPTEYRTISTASFRKILDMVKNSGITPITPRQHGDRSR